MSSVESSISNEAEIVRAVLLLARALRRSVPEGAATGAGLSLLAALQREGSLSANALARAVRLQPQSLSRLLVRLEEDRMIERAVDPADRRRHIIVLTPRGRGALNDAIAYRREWLSSVMTARLSKAERGVLERAAELMIRLAA